MSGVVVLNQPGVYLVTAAGNVITLTDGAAIGSAEALLLAGKDGANARIVRVAADGTVRTDPTGTTAQPVSGTVGISGTVPVSAAALPLPAGAATSANQTTEIAGLVSIDATLALIKAKTDNLDVALSTRAVTGLTDTQLRASAVPVSAASLPLPAGAATAALQTQPGVDIGDVTVNNAAGAAAVNIQDGGNSITVDGPLTDAQLRAVAVPVSAAALPLPTNAATEPTLASRLADATFTGRINTFGQKAMAASTPMVIASDQTAVPVAMAANSYGGQVEGRAAAAAVPVGNPVWIAGWDGTNIRAILTDTLGRVIIAPSGSPSSVKGFADGEVVLAATTIVPVRSTTYTEPSSNAQRSVGSSSANDTAAGTGARTVKITYYALAAGVVTGPFTETLTLNGVTPVNTVAANICFIEHIDVVTIGSTGSNVGVISLFGAAAGAGGTVWSIAATINMTMGSHHYVPSGKTCNITGFVGGIKGADTTGMLLRSKDPTVTASVEKQISDVLRVPSSGQSLRSYGTPIQVAGPARVTAFAAPDSTSSRTYYASFDFYEE